MMYDYQPKQEHESDKIQRALEILKGVVAREDKRHIMDQQLTTRMRDYLESSLIPKLEHELDFDPTPQYLWDETGGESPVTLEEMHTAAHNPWPRNSKYNS